MLALQFVQHAFAVQPDGSHDVLGLALVRAFAGPAQVDPGSAAVVDDDDDRLDALRVAVVRVAGGVVPRNQCVGVPGSSRRQKWFHRSPVGVTGGLCLLSSVALWSMCRSSGPLVEKSIRVG